MMFRYVKQIFENMTLLVKNIVKSFVQSISENSNDRNSTIRFIEIYVDL